MSTFTPSGVITLTTDFGHKGPFVASMKGVMMARFPAVRIVDLTHEVSAHWPAEAGFWLERSYRYFPAGTVHLAVVDPGVGTERDVIAIRFDGHVFIAPDNGLLTPLVEHHGKAAQAHCLDDKRLSKWGVTDISATFHGRDVFAPLAAEVAAGRLHVEDLGPWATDLIPSLVDDPTVTDGTIRASVITVDTFGNLITNVTADLLEGVTAGEVTVGGRKIPLKRTYADVKPGEYLALVNSFGVLEIARAEQSASDGLGAERGAPVTVSKR